MNESTEAHKPSAKERLWEELVKFAYLSAYLWVCFSAILLYQASVSSDPASDLHYGTALIKALLVGKFLLIGEAIKVGSKARGPTLLHRVMWKSIAFLLILIVFTILEEIIVGWFHDMTMIQSVVEYLSRPLLTTFAPVLVMWLILIPLITAVEMRKAMGSEAFRELLRGRN